jgi:hypothetical protein
LRFLQSDGITMHDTATAPEYGRIPEACRRYGLSRSRLYLLAGEGLVRFVKVGNATLVDLGSVRAYLANCPAASIRQSPTAV